MFEIDPVLPMVPVVKPRKIERDESFTKKQPRKKKQDAEKPNIKPAQHIDEMV